MEEVLKRSPLHELHVEAGAKLAPFGGWLMPLHYPEGTLREHRTCRSDVVVFDVSHLGTVRVSGPETLDLLQRTLSNDLTKVAPGRAQYSHLLDEDGSVVDDVIVWWIDETTFDVMPNASNTAGVIAALGGTDVTHERAILAVQGPRAREAVGRVSAEAAAVGRFHIGQAQIGGSECVVAGTGYTGEDGLEIAVPVDAAPAVWSALVDAGAAPAGLGARDTLRLEAGLPLHGSELGAGITPLQAGLGWVVGWKKGEFRGRAALEAEREAGPARRLFGLRASSRRPLRAEQQVRLGDVTIGVTTSGNFSPMLDCGIALAFLTGDIDVGSVVQVDARGGITDATVVRPPFV